jgi:hypothetical protein
VCSEGPDDCVKGLCRVSPLGPRNCKYNNKNAAFSINVYRISFTMLSCSWTLGCRTSQCTQLSTRLLFPLPARCGDDFAHSSNVSFVKPSPPVAPPRRTEASEANLRQITVTTPCQTTCRHLCLSRVFPYLPWEMICHRASVLLALIAALHILTTRVLGLPTRRRAAFWIMILT